MYNMVKLPNNWILLPKIIKSLFSHFLVAGSSESKINQLGKSWANDQPIRTAENGATAIKWTTAIFNFLDLVWGESHESVHIFAIKYRTDGDNDQYWYDFLSNEYLLL